MNRLLNKVKKSKMVLIASLPENSYELAKCAWEAGADAIKVHVNVWHRASNNTFATIEEQKELLKKIVNDSPVPVGIVLGDSAKKAEESLEQAVELGFDFVSLYSHHTSPNLLTCDKIDKFFAVDYTYSFDQIKLVNDSNFATFLELSICRPETYGERLNGLDLMKYKYISEHVDLPTIVPTQHVVKPSDIPLLHDCHIAGIMIGAVTYGKDKDNIFKTLKAFREAIDKL